MVSWDETSKLAENLVEIYISKLEWECLGIPSDELEKTAGNGDARLFHFPYCYQDIRLKMYASLF